MSAGRRVGYELRAEHEVAEAQVVGLFRSLGEARAHVDRLDERGEWPEGFDAVCCAPDGSRWLYASEWEQLEPGRAQDWEVLSCGPSDRNGGVLVVGWNHSAGEAFNWYLSGRSVLDARYDWSGCRHEPGSLERLVAQVERALRKR